MIRSIVVLGLLAGTASADSFVELAGGLVLPASDNDWTNLVDPSFKLGARAGGGRPDIEAIVVADWSPMSPAGNIAFTDLRYNRFRVLGGVQVRHSIAPKLMLSARLGLGVDIAHAGFTTTIGPLSAEGSDTDTGFAFEPAVAIWWSLGSTQVGFELALPYSHHDKMASQMGDFTFHYTSIDVDLLGVIRFGT